MTFDKQFLDKEYRDAYADTFLDTSIATQLRVLREQRELTQGELADLCDMKQSRISTMEDVNYSNWSIKTLKRLAHALDVPLFVSWGRWPDLMRSTDNFSRAYLQRPDFANDPQFTQHAEISQATTVNVSARGNNVYHFREDGRSRDVA